MVRGCTHDTSSIFSHAPLNSLPLTQSAPQAYSLKRLRTDGCYTPVSHRAYHKTKDLPGPLPQNVSSSERRTTTRRHRSETVQSRTAFLCHTDHLRCAHRCLYETGPGRARLPDGHLKIGDPTNQTPMATTETGEAISYHSNQLTS